MFGTGFPEMLHLEADVALTRYLAATGRIGGLPTFFFSASAGLLGLLPLSADTALIPRHALGLGVELSTTAIWAGESYDSWTHEDLFPNSSSGPTVSAGYLYTASSGFHVRVMGGVFVSTWGNRVGMGNLRVSLGGIL
ncbi:hypothetical protein AKJ08_1295 [Vulgatibacter incomptus]|uniref:Uncharacterized protein n=2 Tax=Vulgatibacter incomptus TaxID=1391653 RepID=A0A0K1PBJ2_9BACT|nr:hypothetical protein AKJ08_1295 [Vulgatibacter incomptus]